MIPSRRTSLFACLLSAVWIAVVGVGQAPASAASDVASGFVDRVYRDESGNHKYVVFVPADYTPAKKWPTILFLHGAGERGSDGRSQTTVGLGPYVRARQQTFPFLVVFPQCEDVKGRMLTGWLPDSPDGKRAIAILDAVEQEFSVDTNREILTGWSKGGYGVWSIAGAMPGRWSAIVPLAGGGDPAWASKLKEIPVWAFHGANDAAVRPNESRRMIDALKAAGTNPRYSEVPDVAHDVWKVAYSSDELYAWMLDPHRVSSSAAALRVKPGQRRSIASTPNSNEPPAGGPIPFVPAVVIPKAVYVRLGNEMLETLAYSIPKIVPRDVLSGRLDDISDSITAEGRTFSVLFSGLTYDGRLARAHIQAYQKDRLNIQLGLTDVTLTIGATYVRGRGRSAEAGPIHIVIGHRRPVWLSFDVTPVVERGKIRLRLLNTQFRIPDDNWYITSPASVRTRGLGMTRRRVTEGLVSGLYASKGRIEAEVAAVVPPLIKQLEDKLTLADVDRLVEGVWPLPVYKPRIQLWPEEISTDNAGVSIVLGVAAAAVDPAQTPKRLRVARPVGFSVSDVPRGTSLQVGVAPNMLETLTDLLIQADVARIHVLDIPGKTFAPLSVSKALAEAAPDLKRYGENVEIWAELILASPVTVVDESPGSSTVESRTLKDKLHRSSTLNSQLSSLNSHSTNSGGSENEKPLGTFGPMFQFEVPKLIISYAIKTNPKSSAWTPYAEFEIQLAQKAHARVLKTSYQNRALRLDWFGAPDITVTGRFAPDYTPANPHLDVERIKQLFVRGWRAWTMSGPVSQVAIPDIDFGYTKLRISDVGWSSPYLYAKFAPAGVKITNSSQQPFAYETKGPYSGWGGPYTLQPGASHEFPIAYPMLYRRRTDSGLESYTLPVGSHSEFRMPTAGGAPQLFQVREHSPENQTARWTP